MEEIKRMITKIIICLVFCVALMFGVITMTAQAEEEPDGVTYLPIEATAYCYGTTRCDGGRVRIGIAAAKPEWYGKTACIYMDDNGEPGEFIGYFELLDTGGDYRIQDGKCIDIYHPDEEWCRQFGRRKVLVVLVDAVG